jgi:hypothetical protein
MTPALLLATAFVFADKDEAKYQFMLKKAAEDSVEVRTEKTRTVFVITSKSGIGEGIFTLSEGQWPRDVVLRFQSAKNNGFKNLESFHQDTNRLKVCGAQRQSGEMELHFTGPDGKVGDVAGKLNIKVETRDGALEVTLPAFLLTGSKQAGFSWIDAFRR